MFADASYLDLFMTYGVHPSKIHKFFSNVLNWINKTLPYPFVKALKKEDFFFFSFFSTTYQHHFQSILMVISLVVCCIGVLDGMAVKIICPTLTKLLKNLGAYFCREGYHALNLQAISICDKHKRFMWLSSKHAGSCYDSRAFVETKLYQLLMEKRECLELYEFFIVGDLAYNPESFLLRRFGRGRSACP